MEIFVCREIYTPDFTISKITIQGNNFTCVGAEPGASTGKLIPEGRYEAIIQQSPHFSQIFGKPFNTVWLFNVPNFQNVENHPGNFPRDTEGCTLIAQAMTFSAQWEIQVINSDITFATYIGIIQSALNIRQRVFITYTDTMIPIDNTG